MTLFNKCHLSWWFFSTNRKIEFYILIHILLHLWKNEFIYKYWLIYYKVHISMTGLRILTLFINSSSLFDYFWVITKYNLIHLFLHRHIESVLIKMRSNFLTSRVAGFTRPPFLVSSGSFTKPSLCHMHFRKSSRDFGKRGVSKRGSFLTNFISARLVERLAEIYSTRGNSSWNRRK